MTDAISPLPEASPRSRWWTVLLVVSLAANLLVGGVIIAHLVRGDRPERISGASYTQLIPRSFFGQISGEKRREVLDILKRYRDDFRADRRASEAAAARLADAIMAEPYNVDNVKQVINEFAATSSNLVNRGGSAALDVLAILTPEERKILANSIRKRGSRGPRK